MSSPNAWRPYGEGLPPGSEGRILLCEMMADYCDEQWQMSSTEVLEALHGRGDPDEVSAIFSTVGFLADLLRSGRIPTVIRPFGGGDPEPFPASRWEIDNPVPRFVTSAVDPDWWFEVDAEPHCWIFVDRAAYELFMEEWLRPSAERIADEAATAGVGTGPIPPDASRTEAPSVPTPTAPETEAPPLTVVDDPGPIPKRLHPARPRGILRLTEVMARTRLSRSEVYRRMDRDAFPQSIKLGTNMVGWYEDEIEAWVESLRS